MYKYISASQGNLKSILKLTLIVVFCISTAFILLCVSAFVISKTDFSYEVLSTVIAAILGISAFFNSFVLSRLFKENGLLWGVFSASVLVVCLIIISVYNNTFNLSHNFFVKTVVIFASGAIGGITGVNIN